MLTSDLNEFHIAYLYFLKRMTVISEKMSIIGRKKRRKVKEGTEKLSMKRVEVHPQYVSFLV